MPDLSGLRHDVRERCPDMSDQDMVETWIHVELAHRRLRTMRDAKVRLIDLESDGNLESEIERLNDLLHDGEGYENYVIVADRKED